MHIALFQPEIPPNVGSILRFCACMDVHAHIIHPCGFPFHIDRMKRSIMDYWPYLSMEQHFSWSNFCEQTVQRRHVLLDVTGTHDYRHFSFTPQDILITGRESDGFPQSVRAETEHSVYIPMYSPGRSLNVTMALSVVLGEALRQTRPSQPYLQK